VISDDVAYTEVCGVIIGIKGYAVCVRATSSLLEHVTLIVYRPLWYRSLVSTALDSYHNTLSFIPSFGHSGRSHMTPLQHVSWTHHGD
jgi:hypothetical protein